MAQIALTIPNAQIARVVDALCKVGGYSGNPTDTAARNEFARMQLGVYVRRTVLEVERREAMQAVAAALPVTPPIDVT